MTHDASLPTIELQTKDTVDRTVIWLHGLGADGHDFVPIVNELALERLPGIRFIFPHAPMRAITINGGMGMRAWYDIKLMDLVKHEDQTGINESQQQINALIEREHKRGIPSEHIVLAGFSQGSAMTLHTGLRYPERLAGLIALSGYVPVAHTLSNEASPQNRSTPILMAHGTQDPVVPLQRGQESYNLLNTLGYQVNWKTYPMQHSVHPDEIRDISNFLNEILI